MIVYLVRHTSVNVPKGITYGFSDVELNNTFEEEAAKTKAELENISFDEVFCSPLTRCRRLADYCGFKNPIIDNRLKEMNFGDWEMKSWDEIYADPLSKEWFRNWTDTRTPNGESLREQYQRVADFLSEKKAQHYNKICIFAHGGVLTCARVFAKEYPIEDAFKSIPQYGEVIKIEI